MRTSPRLLLLAAALAGCAKSPAPVPAPSGETTPVAPAPEAVPAAVSTAPAKPATASIRSWALYYGPATPEMADRLGGHDLVVVDPAALGDKATAAESVAALKARGCRVVGYLSAIEVAKWHAYKDRVSPEWFILVNGKPWIPWGGSGVGWEANHAVSLAVPEWRAILAELVADTILGCGCDGVFFDTLEDLDWPVLPAEEAARQREGLKTLLHDLRTAHPDALLFANRTLGATLDVVAEDADGICWEDFAAKHFENPDVRPWMNGVAERIAACRERRGANRPFLVLALWNVDAADDDTPARQAKMRELATERGYLPFCMVGGYHRLQPAP